MLCATSDQRKHIRRASTLEQGHKPVPETMETPEKTTEIRVYSRLPVAAEVPFPHESGHRRPPSGLAARPTAACPWPAAPHSRGDVKLRVRSLMLAECSVDEARKPHTKAKCLSSREITLQIQVSAALGYMKLPQRNDPAVREE